MIKEKFYVGVNMVNFNYELKNSAILGMFGDTAGIHSVSVGDSFGKSNERWILTSYNVHINKRPLFGDHICVSTWSVSYKNVSAVREFEIKSMQGETLIYATSTWALVDITCMRPVKITDERMVPYNSGEHKSNFENINQSKLIVKEDVQKITEFKVTEHFIDLNSHLNNSFFIMIAETGLDENTKKNLNNLNFEIAFKKEIKQNDIIETFLGKEDGNYYILLKNKQTGSIHAIIKYYK